MKRNTLRTNALLLGIGALLLVLTQARCAVAILAWISPIPFLIYLKTTTGWRSRLAFMGVMCLSFTLAAAKFVGAPLPAVMSLFNGVVFGLYYASAYLVWSAIARPRPRPWIANLGFAAIMIVFEWLLHRLLGIDGNTAIGYSQLDNLPYLQLASLLGLAGLSFFIYWFAAVAAESLQARRVNRNETAALVGLIATIHIFGAYRIGLETPTPTVRAAAVATDWSWWPSDPLPTDTEQRRILDALFDRSERAAAAGAEVVVWPEVAAWVAPSAEAGIITRGKALAKARRIHLVLSYLVPKEPSPLLVENKYVWIERSGATHEYLKHKPLPFEPSIPGDGAPQVVRTRFGKASGAICYDADFPHVVRRHAEAGISLLVLPSADTRGVSPFHTRLAAVRAIEGGYSIVRATRHGLSAGIGPEGRIRGWLSANESKDDILVVTLPARHIPTLYSLIGDLPVWLACLGVLALFGAGALRIIRR